MNPEIKNLDKLTDQIYREGIEKAEKESKEILTKAHDKYDKIVGDAQAEADRIISSAKREANRLRESVLQELQLKSEQLISDLKYEIEGLLSDKILRKNIRGQLADESFLKTIILEIVNQWKVNGEVELILSDHLESKISDALVKSIRKTVPNLTVSLKNLPDSGFRVARKSDHYQLSFGEEDFISLFRTYLSDIVQKQLFNP